MIKAIIIEDEPKAAELLSQMLEEIDAGIIMLDLCPDLPSAIKSIRKHAPDIVFLDVQLPVYNGLQLLDFLNPEEITFKIIFTTASNEHALRAFDMSAVDYVLKPIQFEKLQNAVQKYLDTRNVISQYPFAALKDNFYNTGVPKIIIPQSNGFEILKLDEIVYIKAEGSYAKIFLENEKKLTVSHNLKYFEDMLRSENFFIRIHRSFLVNIHFAKRIVRSNGTVLVMENEEELPVSLEKLDSVLNFFNFDKKKQM